MTTRTKAQRTEYHFGCTLARKMLKSGETPAYIRRAAERTQASSANHDPLWHRAAGMLWVLDNDLDRWLTR